MEIHSLPRSISTLAKLRIYLPFFSLSHNEMGVYNEAPILTQSQKELQYLLKCYAREWIPPDLGSTNEMFSALCLCSLEATHVLFVLHIVSDYCDANREYNITLVALTPICFSQFAARLRRIFDSQGAIPDCRAHLPIVRAQLFFSTDHKIDAPSPPVVQTHQPAVKGYVLVVTSLHWPCLLPVWMCLSVWAVHAFCTLLF